MLKISSVSKWILLMKLLGTDSLKIANFSYDKYYKSCVKETNGLVL